MNNDVTGPETDGLKRAVRTRFQMVFDAEMSLVIAPDEDPAFEAFHIWKVDEVTGRAPLCGQELKLGQEAHPDPLSFFCLECWAEFEKIREKKRHPLPIRSIEGWEVTPFWSEAEGCMNIRLHKTLAKTDSTVSTIGTTMSLSFEEADAVNLVYHLTSMLLDILDQALAVGEGAGEMP